MIPAMSDRTPTGIRLDNDRTAVTIAEAARVLGLSTDAVRKRLHRGTLAGEKIGETWRVFLEAETVEEPAQDRPDPSSREPDSDRTRPDALVEALREEVAFLRRELETRTDELQRRDVLLREALARIPALGAGQDAPVAAPKPQHEVPPVVPAAGPSVPWWKFWERWGAG